MKKKTIKTKSHKNIDKPIGRLKRVADFLPPPDKLLPKEETTKITITLDIGTVEFFKEIAEENGTKYQRMMREVLKGYASKHSA